MPELDTDEQQLFELDRHQAQHESDNSIEHAAYWLRGIRPLILPDPLGLDYPFKSSFEGRLDVQGCLVGGDGSGGRHTRDPRLRRCAFSMVVIRPGNVSDPEVFKVLGIASGPIPGKQTVPRAETTGIWHTLRFTKGNAVYLCDNLGVAKSYRKGTSYAPESNGLLWRALNQARTERIQLGYGVLEVVWIPSHKSLETLVNQGYSEVQWAANQLADQLATEAAKEVQLGGCCAADNQHYQENCHAPPILGTNCDSARP